MKKSVFFLLTALLPLGMSAQRNDLYSSKKNSSVGQTVEVVSPAATTTTPVASAPVTTTPVVSAPVASAPVQQSVSSTRTDSYEWDEDAYNRRRSYTTDAQTDADIIYVHDTVYVENTVYDDEDDYNYSIRLIRFHGPDLVYHISSPYYWDVVYALDWGRYNYYWDWDFYLDPWSLHWHSYYDPFYYSSWSYGFGYGWYPHSYG